MLSPSHDVVHHVLAEDQHNSRYVASSRHVHALHSADDHVLRSVRDVMWLRTAGHEAVVCFVVTTASIVTRYGIV